MSYYEVTSEVTPDNAIKVNMITHPQGEIVELCNDGFLSNLNERNK